MFVLASSGGNVFLVEELGAAGLEEQTVRLTPRLHDILMARFEVLSEEAQEALRALAVTGRRVDHRLLAAVYQARDDCELLRALREAVAQRILMVDADGLYVFRHALVRDVIYEDLIGGERLRLHAAVARALADDPSLGPQGASGAVELAFHLDKARTSRERSRRWSRRRTAAPPASTPSPRRTACIPGRSSSGTRCRLPRWRRASRWRTCSRRPPRRPAGSAGQRDRRSGAPAADQQRTERLRVPSAVPVLPGRPLQEAREPRNVLAQPPEHKE